MAAKSFEEVFADTSDRKRESDLTNLAHALLAAKDAEMQAIDLQNRIKATAASIECGKIVSVDEVASLYEEATGRKRRL